VDGMPLGTRGGTRFEYTFPADGEYRVTITDLDFGLYPRGVENETTVVVLIDRKEVFREKIGGDADRRHGSSPSDRQQLVAESPRAPSQSGRGTRTPC
jgi:hypothetical protein